MATACRSTESFRTDVRSTIRSDVARSARRNRSDRPSAAYRPAVGDPQGLLGRVQIADVERRDFEAAQSRAGPAEESGFVIYSAFHSQIS